VGVRVPLPLQVNTIGERHFGPLIKKAGVRRIKFHGLRHTVATLMLSAGVPAHVVQRRLGHAKIEMTLGIYAHALPSMQQEAAAKLALFSTAETWRGGPPTRVGGKHPTKSCDNR
jgi:hypothetical protein